MALFIFGLLAVLLVRWGFGEPLLYITFLVGLLTFAGTL